jgi:hypothetical protein
MHVFQKDRVVEVRGEAGKLGAGSRGAPGLLPRNRPAVFCLAGIET